MWAMQRFGIQQVDSVVARAALARDEADLPPEWVLELDAVTDMQVRTIGQPQPMMPACCRACCSLYVVRFDWVRQPRSTLWSVTWSTWCQCLQQLEA
jgi:hypothetical protein